MTAAPSQSDRRSLKIYGSAVWNHWLDSGGGGFGADLIRRAWVVSDLARPADFALASYDRAISGAGGRGFTRQFVRFAAATAEWRTGFGGFPDGAAYTDVRRQGALPGARRSRISLDHTAYRLLEVHPTSARKLVLHVNAERGVRSGIALIARDGSATDGSVVARERYLARGGGGSVTLTNPRRFDRITAVAVNADDRVRGFGNGDWIYSKNRARFSLRLSG